MVTTMLKRLSCFVGVYLAGVVAGAALVFYGGPMFGRQLTHTGARLIGLDGDHAVQSATEVQALVALAVEEELSRRQIDAVEAMRRLPATRKVATR